MALSDVALAALLQAQDREAQRPDKFQIIANAIPNALANLQTMLMSQRETQAKYGIPTRGEAPRVVVGAVPDDTRRRFFGIPMGAERPISALPQTPGGPTDISSVPPELLTPDVTAAAAGGQPVFLQGASGNYRRGQPGLEDLKVRQDLLRDINVKDVPTFLSEPDLGKAAAGATMRDKPGGAQLIPVTPEMRQSATQVYGYDIFAGRDFTPVSTSNQLYSGIERRNRPQTKLIIERLKQTISKGTADDIVRDLSAARQLVSGIETGTVDATDDQRDEAYDSLSKLTEKFRKMRVPGAKPRKTDEHKDLRDQGLVK